MRLYIIRHGETDWNGAGRLQGQTDTRLNENGIRLARETAKGMENIPFDLCITSPLARARQTAEIVLGDRQIPIQEEPRIREISFGSWEGLGCRSHNYQIPVPIEEFDLFYTDPFRFTPAPDGETIEAVCARTRQFLEELMAEQSYQDKTILIATHGCALRALLNSVYPDPTDFWHHRVPPNCAVSIVEVKYSAAVKDRIPVLVESDKIYYNPSQVVDFRTGKRVEA